MRPNCLRELLRAGRPSLGTHICIEWPAITELVGYSGNFDYIEFVGESAPYDLRSLENLGRAIDLFPHMTGMMKIEQQPRLPRETVCTAWARAETCDSDSKLGRLPSSRPLKTQSSL
jgi:hypothetical protein